MHDILEKALDVIYTFDWYWRMDDSNYKQNKAKAEAKKNEFTALLGKLDKTQGNQMEAKKLLVKLWVAYYDSSTPYKSNDFYEERLAEIGRIEWELSELAASAGITLSTERI